MFIADLFVALAFGWFVVWVISHAFGTKGPWDNFLWFFLVVSLFAWAGGIWLVPFGPAWRGIGWLPIIFMGIMVALLLTAASPRPSRKHLAAKEQAIADAESKADVDAIFWVLIICLLFFGIAHYAWYPRLVYPVR
jgi:hypothetical protein